MVLPLNTSAGIIWLSPAARMVCSQELLELGITNPKANFHADTHTHTHTHTHTYLLALAVRSIHTLCIHILHPDPHDDCRTHTHSSEELTFDALAVHEDALLESEVGHLLFGAENDFA